MSTSYSSAVFYGVELSWSKVLDLLGAKYETKIYDKCPNDNRANPDKGKFCGECGIDLRHKAKIKEGIDDADDLETILEHFGLECEKFEYVNATDGDYQVPSVVVIGEKLAEPTSGKDYSIDPFNLSSKIAKEVEAKLKKIGIDKQPKLYLVTERS